MKYDWLKIYLVLLLATWGVVFIIIGIEEKDSSPEDIIIERLHDNDSVMKNIHDLKYQYVSTTYHDYVVILYKGSVVDKGVIHMDTCKCKNNQ